MTFFAQIRWTRLDAGLLLAVLLLAGMLFYRGYDFSLPYVDHPDEPAFNLAARMILDQGTAQGMSFQGYPPGIITLNQLLYSILGRDTAPELIYRLARLITITFSMGIVGILYLWAKQIRGTLAAVCAVLLYILCPPIQEAVRPALANTYVSFFSVMTLFLLAQYVRAPRVWVLHGASYALMLAICFKTQAIFLLPLLALTPFLLLVTQRLNRVEAFHVYYLSGWRWGLFLSWLLLLYPTLQANQLPYFVASTDSLTLPSAEQIAAVLANAIRVTVPVVVLIPAAIGVLLMLRGMQRASSVLLITAALVWVIGISLFGQQDIRQYLVVIAFVALLGGCGLATLAEQGVKALRRRILSPLVKPAIAVGILLVVGISLLPQFSRALDYSAQLMLPDARNDIARYVDSSLESAPYIATYNLAKVLNPDWGGYTGQRQYSLAQQTVFSAENLASWQQQGIVFALDDSEQALPDGVTVLKDYPSAPGYRYSGARVIWLNTPDVMIGQALGDIAIIGADIASEAQADGQLLRIRLYYQAAHPLAQDVQVFIHAFNAAGERVAQADGAPIADNTRPTTTWDDPQEILVSQQFILRVPDGAVRIVTGLYDLSSGQRLLTADGQDAVPLLHTDIQSGIKP